MKVLSFGSLNIDYVYDVPHFVSGGETLASKSLNIYSGGKGLNQSIALSKAGLEVYHAGAIGNDGNFLLDILKASGVNTQYVKIFDETKTGHAIIQKNDEGNNCILLYGGANQKITKEQIKETLKHFSKGDALVIQNEINELFYLVEQAKKIEMVIALNPSPMDENLNKLLPFVDYLILNEVEAAQFLNIKEIEDPEKMAKDLNKKIPSAKIVLTIGEKGSLYSDGEKILHQEAMKVQAIDTTAAGDTYTGYFLAGIFNGNLPEWSMNYATKASAISVTRHGAAPSIPESKEVLEQL
ncbi:ribokinase [Neocallimastix lanati (nom. inval.)]|jgi:ribokinase|uniref:Ribokinase n=1 Tax=Neocallimastix californiae TaxID=1754190 RepID=A0A1Y2D4Y1_9FUNG|nr:ribokinase [Neocallimastix sp. JGI-2020a]ORY54300.1 ribokinase [Neocallimastix californiae]|eukprot:ORY54300.1 ribokinase [Neocallimastix californiae]